MDHYNTLGVNHTTQPDEIKKAYRKLASKHHPDKGGDPEQFKKIQEAYETLSDPDKKYQYDNPMQNQFGGGQNPFGNAGFDFNDIFGGGFQQRRQPKNRDISIGTRITLEESLKGKSLIATYRLNSGKEERINIDVPRGARHGDTIKFGGFGDDYDKRFPRGDLLVKIQIEKHPVWTRDGDDLFCQKSINVFDFLLGNVIIIKTLDNKTLQIKLPKGTQVGQNFSINGHGMPNVRTGRRGNAYVRVMADIPNITDNELLTQIEELKNGIIKSTK
jgi:curved DNA-binding protein